MRVCICTVPEHDWGTASKCDPSGPATRTHWGNGGRRLLTPEAFTTETLRRAQEHPAPSDPKEEQND